MRQFPRQTSLSLARIGLLLTMPGRATRAPTISHAVSLPDITILLVTVVLGLSDANILIDLALMISKR
jgi:hypothetical protein